MQISLPTTLRARVEEAWAEWLSSGKTARLWERDPTLWTGADESSWLGWLSIAEEGEARVGALRELADTVAKEGMTHCLLLGMGGSSLCPEVFARTFGPQPGRPTLHVLDSTDPAQVRAFEQKVDLARTLFVVASKSGSTLEPSIFQGHFWERVKSVVGAEAAGSRFVAITDPGSKLEASARALGFRHIELGVPSIGGRYSAMSAFGMLPAAVMGLDPGALLARARTMAGACRVAGSENPGVRLGITLGEAAKLGRDKLTIVAAPPIASLGAWFEQLIAESTGKQGQGIIPVDLEPQLSPTRYGADRVFAFLRVAGSDASAQQELADGLIAAGHPVIQIELADKMDVAAEFFRWEFATAVAGSVLGIHPFDQPDVEASKIETKKLTSQFEEIGSMPSEDPFATDAGVRLFADPKNTAALREGGQRAAAAAGRTAPTLGDFLRAHLARVKPGDYVALLAYVEMSSANEAALQEIRREVLVARGAATCLGFGPRFLHSTGQAYKGGPNSGVFLQITCDDANDLPVPGARYTFGIVKAAQARGDFAVLAQRDRRALRLHLPSDVRAGLQAVRRAIGEALRA